MKHLSGFLLFASLMMIISSCSEKALIEDINNQDPETEAHSFYVINYNKSDMTFKEMTLADLNRSEMELENKNYKNNSNHSAHGIVTTTSPNTLVFNAVENKSGIHGQNYVDGSYFVNVKFNSESLTVLNNQAFFGGTITSWEAGPELPAEASVVEEGWLLFFAVEDNGEGINSADALGGGLLIFPPGTTLAFIEQLYQLPAGHYATLNINSITDLMAALYAYGEEPYIFVEGEDPTNVQVK